MLNQALDVDIILGVRGAKQQGRIHAYVVTRLPQSREGGQGLYLRSTGHLDKSSEVKELENIRKVKCDRTRPDTRLPQSRAGGQGP